MRYNNLTAVIRRSLETLLKALRGLVVMDAGMEALSASIFNGSIPKAWADVSYPSLKPLGAYVNDLVRRLQFLREWVEGGVPQVVWLPGIFFTQSFLTGVLQNYARKHGIPVDEICFDFEFLDAERPAGRPDEGVYVSGLFLEGARWDYAARSLSESQPKVLFTPAPVIWLRPCRAAEVRAVPHFECPVYRTSARRGVLSTTGHSTNFVMSMRLPSTLPPSHWVERGVALLTQLDD
jgi:dynein heavy chain